jgi:hypothetical protein
MREALFEALNAYFKRDVERDEALAELSAEAEETGCYRNFDYARSDWAETMDEAGQNLAQAVLEILSEVK